MRSLHIWIVFCSPCIRHPPNYYMYDINDLFGFEFSVRFFFMVGLLCRHFLCKCRYNCGTTDHSHWHVLRKRHCTYRSTDQSHRHLPCNRHNICGDASQLVTFSRPFPAVPWSALRHYRKRLRTVANGCERLRTETQLLANAAPPQTPEVKWESSPRIRGKTPVYRHSSRVGLLGCFGVLVCCGFLGLSAVFLL